MMEKVFNSRDDENNRKGPQWDRTTMDKAKDLTFKKNQEKGNEIYRVLNSSQDFLFDMARKMNVNTQHNVADRMQTIDIIKQLENVTYLC
jgi:hypothetical protein